MSDLQTIVNSIGKTMRQERGRYHVTLGRLISFLEECDPDNVVNYDDDGYIGGFDNPHSYRGFYEDLAFEPSYDLTSVKDVLEMAHDARGNTFIGYKGGEFIMDNDTPLWIAHNGNIGVAVTGIKEEGNHVILETKYV